MKPSRTSASAVVLPMMTKTSRPSLLWYATTLWYLQREGRAPSPPHPLGRTTMASTKTVNLLSAVTYTSTKGQAKAALVIGTPESTQGVIPENQLSLTIFNPLTGRRYQRFAIMNEDGTYQIGRA